MTQTVRDEEMDVMDRIKRMEEEHEVSAGKRFGAAIERLRQDQGLDEVRKPSPALSIEEVQEDNSVLYLKSRRSDLAAMEAEVSELDVEIATIGNRIKADQQRLAEKIKQRSDTVFLKSVIEDSIQQLKARGV